MQDPLSHHPNEIKRGSWYVGQMLNGKRNSKGVAELGMACTKATSRMTCKMAEAEVFSIVVMILDSTTVRS